MTEIYYYCMLKCNHDNIIVFKEYHKTKVFFYTVLLRSILFDKNKNAMFCCDLFD